MIHDYDSYARTQTEPVFIIWGWEDAALKVLMSVYTGWRYMIDQNFDPISDTIYAVDTIAQLPKAS